MAAEDAGRVAGRRTRRAERRMGLLIVPMAVLLTLFFLIPMALLVTRSLTEFQPTEDGKGVFANYAWVFTTDVNVTVLLRTFETAGIVTLAVTIVAYPFAYAMTRVSPLWRGVMFGIVIVTFWSSAVIRNYAWLILFQRTGLVNTTLGWLGLGPVEVLGTTTAVVIGMAHFMLPYALLPLYASLSAIDNRLVLAAQGLGARPSVAFWRVYFPLSLPGLSAGMLLVFVLCLGFYVTPAILGSPQNSMFAQLLVQQVSVLLAWGRGGAMGVILFLTTLILLGFSAVILRRGGEGSRDV